MTNHTSCPKELREISTRLRNTRLRQTLCQQLEPSDAKPEQAVEDILASLLLQQVDTLYSETSTETANLSRIVTSLDYVVAELEDVRDTVKEILMTKETH